MHAVTPDRAQIWWDATGAGPPVVLSPGRGDRSHQFPAEFSHRLVGGGCRVLRLDPREPLPTGDDHEALADDLLVVLDAAGADRGHFVGVASSGPILVELAKRWPDRVRSLSFVCATSPGADRGLRDLACIGCPCLIIHGAADRSVPLAHAYALANGLPNAFLQLHPTMEHVPTHEDWRWIAELVLAHVRAASC